MYIPFLVRREDHFVIMNFQHLIFLAEDAAIECAKKHFLRNFVTIKTITGNDKFLIKDIIHIGEAKMFTLRYLTITEDNFYIFEQKYIIRKYEQEK